MAYINFDPQDYFNTKLYTGNGSTQSITGVGFQPDLVWYKSRSNILSSGLFDVIRGTSKQLYSNETVPEGTYSGVTSFDSDGFSLGSDAGGNQSSATYVAWNWKANGSGVSNTDGSITSTVSVNTTSGFSIVSYTGTGSAATVGHGLGSAPKMIMLKNRNRDSNWIVYHKNLTSYDYRISIDSTAAESNSEGSTYWTADPTSTVFSIGTNIRLNANTETQIAYCFEEKKGFSKFGTYTGNGNADGPFIYTGFKVALLVIKERNGGNSWQIFDNKRPGYNLTDRYLKPNESAAEVSGNNQIDILSNGIKLRSSNTANNGSGQSFVYMAFAENPLINSLGNSATAR